MRDDGDTSYRQETAARAVRSCKVQSQVCTAETGGHLRYRRHRMTSFVTAAAAARHKRHSRSCQSFDAVL